MREAIPQKSERTFSPEEIQDFRQQIERVTTRGVEILLRDHSNKLYHDPEHTIGEKHNGVYEQGGVRLGAKRLAEAFVSSFSDYFTPQQNILFPSLVYSAMTYHDTVININRVNEDGFMPGSIARLRGFKESQNEFESYRLWRNMFLKERYALDENQARDLEALYAEVTDPKSERFDPLFTWADTEAKKLCEATVPSIFNPNVNVASAEIQNWYPETVQTELSDQPNFFSPEAGATVTVIGSEKAAESMAGFCGSVADLIAALARPTVSLRKGYEELFELNVLLSAWAIKPERMTQADLEASLTSMEGWARTQVGIPIGQRKRLETLLEPKTMYTLVTGKDSQSEIPADFVSAIDRFRETITPFTNKDGESILHACSGYTSIRTVCEALRGKKPQDSSDDSPLTSEQRSVFQEIVSKNFGMKVERLEAYVKEVIATKVPGTSRLGQIVQ